MATTKNTRVVLRTLQGRGPVLVTRTTRAVQRVLQSRPLNKVSATTRVVLRRLQSLYASSRGVVSGMTLADIKPTPFPHNWVSAVRLETSFFTDVTESAESDSEERRALRESPGRTVTASFTGMTKDDSARLLLAVLRYCDQSNVFPLYSDVTSVTEASSGSFLKCNTKFRRFFKGQWVLVAEFNGKRLVNEQYLKIISILPTMLGVTSITGSIPVGAKVYPLIEIDPNLESSPVLLTDDKVAIDITVLEKLGPSTLPVTSEDDASKLAFLQWHGGYPIFDFRRDWTQNMDAKVIRPGEKFGQGRDQVVSLAGAHPKLGFSIQHTFPNREEFDEYLRFAESRRGRMRPFWVLNPQTIFTPQSVAGNDIVVRGITTGVEDWAYFERIGITKTDGTIFISGITNVVAGAGTLTFTLADAPPALVDIRRMSTVHLCRFESDAISEEWRSDGLVRIQSNVIELLNEIDAEVDGDFPDPIA